MKISDDIVGIKIPKSVLKHRPPKNLKPKFGIAGICPMCSGKCVTRPELKDLQVIDCENCGQFSDRSTTETIEELELRLDDID